MRDEKKTRRGMRDERQPEEAFFPQPAILSYKGNIFSSSLNPHPFEKMSMAKHIFVTGGVVSSLGKGLTSASIGLLLERRGLNVRMQKLDPYINVDPGTMSPY